MQGAIAAAALYGDDSVHRVQYMSKNWSKTSLSRAGRTGKPGPSAGDLRMNKQRSTTVKLPLPFQSTGHLPERSM